MNIYNAAYEKGDLTKACYKSVEKIRDNAVGRNHS